jgi:small multidrug resistance pump
MVTEEKGFSMQHWIALLAAMCLNAVANLSVKIGAKNLDAAGGMLGGGAGEGLRRFVGNPTILLGLFCFGTNVLLYIYALQGRSLKITVAYPIMVGGGFVIIALVARFHPVLAERLSAGQWAGVVLVMIGIMLLAFGMDKSVSTHV